MREEVTMQGAEKTRGEVKYWEIQIGFCGGRRDQGEGRTERSKRQLTKREEGNRTADFNNLAWRSSQDLYTHSHTHTLTNTHTHTLTNTHTHTYKHSHREMASLAKLITFVQS